MKTNNIIIVLATVAIVIALANISITLFKVSDLREKISGYATTYGYVNITIIQFASLNMTNDTINWGHGMITTGQTNATLYTVQDGTAQVSNGNWSTAGVSALRLENIGNSNLSLTLQSSLDAYGFFGSRRGSATTPDTNVDEEFKWNITEAYSNSCNGGNSTLRNQWVNVNTTSSITICDDFNYESGVNAMYIDTWLTIPYDALNVSTGGDTKDPLSSTVTAIGSVA